MSAKQRRAVIYARFSPRPGAEDCDSAEKQTERCRLWCEARGLLVEAEYVDAAASGASADPADRPNLEAAVIRASAAGAVLVCYDTSRLSRNTEDTLRIARRLKAKRSSLAFVAEPIDTSTPLGMFMLTMLAATNTLQRQMMADRTRAAMRKYQAGGRRMGRWCPYGWRLDDTSQRRTKTGKIADMVEDAEEQANIKKILELRDLNLSLREIASTMNAWGDTCRGGPWRHMMVRKILARSGSG